LSDGDVLKTIYRSAYFRSFKQVLAVGTWARSSYRRVIHEDVPVHVFPYTTVFNESYSPRRSQSPTIGFVGSLIPRKGLDIALRAVASLPLRHRPSLEIVGDGPERRGLETYAMEAGVNVEWWGAKQPADIDRIRSRWWAQVVPSRYDGWGLVVSEALACGLPVIASDRTGAALDLVRNGYDGHVVRTGEDWAEAIRAFTDEAVSQRQGANAREVARRVSSTRAAAWLSELLEDVEPVGERDLVADAWRELI